MSWLDEQDQIKVEAALEKLRASAQYARYLEYAGGDERFALWLRMVDVKMVRHIGIGHSEIEDWNWRDAFDEGSSPSRAGLDGLHASDTYSALFDGSDA